MVSMQIFWSSAAIAAELGVGRSAVTNWLDRHTDYPEPAAFVQGSEGLRPLWTESQLKDWREWYTRRHTPRLRLSPAQQQALWLLKHRKTIQPRQGISQRTARILDSYGLAVLEENGRWWTLTLPPDDSDDRNQPS